jgi:Tfp pilus assembly protein PilN
MNVIDFLPNDYLARRSRRRANLICLAIAGLAMGGVGAGVYWLYRTLDDTTQCRTQVEQQYVQASQQLEQLKQLEDRKADLLRKVSLSTTLLERVPRSNILARLTNNLPRGMQMTSLSMRMEEVEVRASDLAGTAAGRNAAGKPVASPAAPTSGKPETVRIKQFAFRLNGVAPTDVEVAEYITRLNADPLFCNVDLLFSEELAKKEGGQMRRFELVFRLSPRAEKVMESAAVVEGVAAEVSAPKAEGGAS